MSDEEDLRELHLLLVGIRGADLERAREAFEQACLLASESGSSYRQIARAAGRRSYSSIRRIIWRRQGREGGTDEGQAAAG